MAPGAISRSSRRHRGGLRSPPGALLEAVLEKNMKFWLPTWPQVGSKTRSKTEKKSEKNGTYVKIPLEHNFGAVLESILDGFAIDFGVDFGVLLKCLRSVVEDGRIGPRIAHCLGVRRCPAARRLQY